jgi:Carboxypeptidase regulatory-like domain
VKQQWIQIVCTVLASATLAGPAPAQTETTSVAGLVRDRRGVPQMDAVVELLRADASIVAVAHTDARGSFHMEDLLPGVYQIKASEETFLPSLRQNLHVLAHRKTVANLTLSTLFEAVQWLPAERRGPGEPEDDWKWTLRSETNRPILRFDSQGPVLVSEGSGPQQSGARVTTSGGSRSFGDGGLRHGVEYEGTSASGAHTLLRTSLNTTDGLQAGYLAAYEEDLGAGRVVRTVAAYTDLPDLTAGANGAGRYQAATLRTAETSELTPALRTEIGNELLAMTTTGVNASTRVVAHPFGSITLHDDTTALSYRVATSRNAQDAAALADEETLLPAVTQRGGSSTLEHGLHQELRLRHKAERGASWQLSVFRDSLSNPLVQGSGSISDAEASSGDLLIDPVSAIFRTAANSFRGQGFAGELELPIGSWLAISTTIAAGPALANGERAANLPERSVQQSLAALRPQLSPAITVGAEGTIEVTGTHWRTSYRWQPTDTVTAVDPFASRSSDAYLNVFLRQPIRVGRIFPGGLQAVIDVRNLVAQGYTPFVTPDGSTLFFAQADRSVEGGIAFTF